MHCVPLIARRDEAGREKNILFIIHLNVTCSFKKVKTLYLKTFPLAASYQFAAKKLYQSMLKSITKTHCTESCLASLKINIQNISTISQIYFGDRKF